MRVLAFDTSNYTTSVASFDGTEGHNISRLLDVEQGALGLRQSDALFAHVKRLPELADRLFSDIGTDAGFEAVGVSTRPRAVEGSYMPCFLAGESQARVLGAALGVPVLPFSHQQGHIAASLWGSGHMELMDEPHLAWHLSGGTTELLRVTPEGKGSVHAEKIDHVTVRRDVSKNGIFPACISWLWTDTKTYRAVLSRGSERLKSGFFNLYPYSKSLPLASSCNGDSS